MSDKPELSFEQFSQMCEDAGIVAKPEELEQDYRTGSVLADVTDEVMNAMEKYGPLEGVQAGLDFLEAGLDDLDAEDQKDVEAMRRHAIHLASTAIRFAADLCHDEAGNN